MKLLTKEILAQLPRLGETGDDPDPMVVCKFFYPDFSWAWYAIEFDGEDVFYGLVDGFDRELGCFSLAELKANRGRLGCSIERDRFFEPTKLSKLMDR